MDFLFRHLFSTKLIDVCLTGPLSQADNVPTLVDNIALSAGVSGNRVSVSLLVSSIWTYVLNNASISLKIYMDQSSSWSFNFINPTFELIEFVTQSPLLEESTFVDQADPNSFQNNTGSIDTGFPNGRSSLLLLGGDSQR
jgi:hypothetical protein